MELLSLHGLWLHASLPSIQVFALPHELKFGKDFGTVVRVLRLIAHLFLILTIEDLELVFAKSLNSNYLTDGLLLILATLEQVCGNQGREETLIFL